jgi:hypothetical protein
MAYQKLAQSVFGNVNQPSVLDNFGNVREGGIGVFIQFALNLMIVVGAVYALFNFALAGYGYLSAGGDPKKVSAASSKIWQSIIGLALVAGAFVLAAIVGQLLFGDWNFILKATIPTP